MNCLLVIEYLKTTFQIRNLSIFSVFYHAVKPFILFYNFENIFWVYETYSNSCFYIDK